MVHGPALPSEPAQCENLTNSHLLLAVSNSEGVGRANMHTRFCMEDLDLSEYSYYVDNLGEDHIINWVFLSAFNW